MTITQLLAEARSLVDADATSYPAVTSNAEDVLLRRINTAYENVVGWLINADGTWQFEDTNYLDFAIGTFTLVSGQSRYSFNDKFLQLEEVQILNKSGVYQIIHPIDQKEYDEFTPLSEAYKTAGRPLAYDKVSDDTIDLFPAPDNGINVTLAAGLKIKFKRTASLYTAAEVTTGTKQPGFASPFHIILAYMAALPYAVSFKRDRVTILEAKIQQMKIDLLKHYGRRSKDERKRMSMSPINFR